MKSLLTKPDLSVSVMLIRTRKTVHTSHRTLEVGIIQN